MEKKTIGAFIAALRKASGMTQQELADRLGVSNKAVSRWERDENAPDLSLIPAIAELFGVTCDELLKGERIFKEPQQEAKPEPKVDKQLKSLVNRSIAAFKRLIYISLALSAVGYVCMFGISYGFYRPVIGFAVMLLFVVAAVVVAGLGVGKMQETRRDNELFETADTSLLSRWNEALGTWTFRAFYTALAVVVLSLPMVMTGYHYAVPTFSSYLVIILMLACALFLLYPFWKQLCWRTFTGQPLPGYETGKDPIIRRMSRWQLALLGTAIVLVWLVTVLSETVLSGTVWAEYQMDGIPFVVIGLMLGNIAVFFLYLLKNRALRKEIILTGLRNILLILPVFLASDSLIRYGGFNWVLIILILGSALVIATVFALLDMRRRKKK